MAFFAIYGLGAGIILALLEKSLKETRPGYREYVETTSAFIPWFPRRRPAGQPKQG
jgi:steroid 5-alpha reductase family enzyme